MAGLLKHHHLEILLSRYDSFFKRCMFGTQDGALPVRVYTLRYELVTVDSRLGEVEEPDGSLSHAG